MSHNGYDDHPQARSNSQSHVGYDNLTTQKVWKQVTDLAVAKPGESLSPLLDPHASGGHDEFELRISASATLAMTISASVSQ